MAARTFHIVDVFAEQKYAGNPLAVLQNPRDLDTETCLAMAREFGFSEPTFIHSEGPGADGYDVRIFTPGGEVRFAGHPGPGTAFVLQSLILKQPIPRLTLNLKVGPIPVEVTYRRGYEINRPSLLLLQGQRRADGRFEIRVGGRVQWGGSGVWHV